MDKISIKQRFLESNTNITEVKAHTELTTIGEFQSIDEFEDELWLLQCPKGFNIAAALENQKIKLPGRTNLKESETVAVEYSSGVSHTFGYCNRKGRYALRRLPVRGNILVREELKASNPVTVETAEALCMATGRESVPELIKVRHPLHGHQFDKHIRLDEEIAERLKKADEITLQALHEARSSRNSVKNITKKSKSSHKTQASIIIESDKKKRKYSEYVVENDEVLENKHKKHRKSRNSTSADEATADLQWIKNL